MDTHIEYLKKHFYKDRKKLIICVSKSPYILCANKRFLDVIIFLNILRSPPFLFPTLDLEVFELS